MRVRELAQELEEEFLAVGSESEFLRPGALEIRWAAAESDGNQFEKPRWLRGGRRWRWNFGSGFDSLALFNTRRQVCHCKRGANGGGGGCGVGCLHGSGVPWLQLRGCALGLLAPLRAG